MEKAVHFSCVNKFVFGILHIPKNGGASRRKKGMIFLNAGWRPRIGPSRQYVKYAREFCKAGYYVLRFDIPGLGDSEGQLVLTTDMRSLIENIESTKHAIDFLNAETGITSFKLFGLCGGAYNAILTGAVDPRVEALVLLSLPVEQLGDISEKTFLLIVMRNYMRKLFRWRAWVRLFLLRSNYRAIWKALCQIGRYGKRGSTLDFALWQSFHTFTSTGKKILFIYGNRDPFYQAFEVGFGKRLSSLPQSRQSCYSVHVIDKADHIFSKMQWQKEIIQKSLAWFQDTDIEACPEK
jgi:pimeloyl-ACP methyl ester carboxylesterase